VISPLLSLIQDQVQSMTKLGVESVFLASTQDYQSEQVDITRRLNDVTTHGGVKLLYLTPEKLNNSQMMQDILHRLHRKKLLSRFVIDEAHSISDWGHDFRPDYASLPKKLRFEYPGVPLMALTATANEKVVEDAIRALDMRNVYRYTSSFNRPNLRYEVRKKDGKTIDSIAEYIAKRPNESGVVYCLSRKDCEIIAEKLQKLVREKPGCHRVQVSFYHAELDAHERQRRHSDWSNGIIAVLCATIAFGMGIDKPDVRYVIHYSMPKSITHYYQESGRAGRDGDVAHCILHYNYGDKKILEGMIIKSSTNPSSEATRRKIDQLYTCVRYCEEEFECRRTLQLDFFGEKFDRSQCNKTCDNCRAQREPDRRDLTDVAKAIVRLFNEASSQKRGTRLTLVQLVDLYRGSKSKSATKFLDTSRLADYGGGSKFAKHEAERVAHCMVFDRIIVETSTENRGGFNSDYVELAENANSLLNGTRRFFVNFPKRIQLALEPREKKGKASRKSKCVSREVAAVSSPITVGDGEERPAPPNHSVNETLTVDDTSSDEDTSTKPRSHTSGSKTPAKSVLPHESTKVLISRIKKMATNWAEEERMYGKQVFYWNILSNDAMKSIAAQAPMTMEELKAIGVLGESIVNDYGERIVKIVSSFVDQEQLQEYVVHRPTAKRAKTASAMSQDVVEVPDDDEFPMEDIDFDSIEIPTFKPAYKGSVTASRHFRT
jgi:bloom syndrome protein